MSSAKFLIFLTIFMDLLGFGIIIPILGPISSEYIPAAWAGRAVGMLMASYSLLQMLCSPFWGRLSDRYGRRPILLLSLFGSTASYLLFSFADSYSMLLVSRVLAGVCGANLAAAQAYISDITSEKDRTAGMGLVGIAFGLGFAFGPVLGGVSSHAWHVFFPGQIHHMGPGLVATAICAVNFIWACFKLPESLPPERRGQVHFRRFASTREALANLAHPAIGPLIILLFLVTFAFANMEVSFSIYAKKVLLLREEGIYGLFIFLGLFMAFIQGYLIRKLVKVISEQVIMIVGVTLLTIGLFLLPLHATIVYVLATLTIIASGQGLCMPSVLSLISRSSSAQTQGNVMGTSQSASSLARILGPAIGGPIFDLGPRWPFWTAAAIMAFAIVWSVLTRGRLIAYGARSGSRASQASEGISIE